MSDTAAIIAILILVIFFYGKPDLHDAAMSHLMKDNQCLTIEEVSND